MEECRAPVGLTGYVGEFLSIIAILGEKLLPHVRRKGVPNPRPEPYTFGLSTFQTRNQLGRYIMKHHSFSTVGITFGETYRLSPGRNLGAFLPISN